MIGYSKRREKIIRESAYDKKKKKPGLKFNPGLVLTGVRTTGPWFTNYKVFLQQAQIIFLGDVCVRFCLLYFAPVNGIFHVLIFQVPNIFAKLRCMLVTFILE